MGVFLIILCLVIIFWPWITRWLRRVMAHRAEDMLRRAMGMPTRGEERRNQRKQERAQSRRNQTSSSRKSKRRQQPEGHPAKAMQRVAEDVEFVEIREFHQTIISETESGTKGKQTRIRTEEQISEADYTIISKGK